MSKQTRLYRLHGNATLSGNLRAKRHQRAIALRAAEAGRSLSDQVDFERQHVRGGGTDALDEGGGDSDALEELESVDPTDCQLRCANCGATNIATMAAFLGGVRCFSCGELLTADDQIDPDADTDLDELEADELDDESAELSGLKAGPVSVSPQRLRDCSTIRCVNDDCGYVRRFVGNEINGTQCPKCKTPWLPRVPYVRLSDALAERTAKATARHGSPKMSVADRRRFEEKIRKLFSDA